MRSEPPGLSWIAAERIAVSGRPALKSLPQLAEAGVTHVVNCRAKAQTLLSRDLAAERAAFGAANVAHAPMWDFGQRQAARLWSLAATFAARALDDPNARVLIHCQRGRRRSAMVAYAVLRLRGRTADQAAALIVTYRAEARLVPAYLDSVERWLAAAAQGPPG